MPISDKQFKILEEQLRKKKEALGDEGYNEFLQRAASASQPKQPEDDDGFGTDLAQGVAKSAGELGLGLGTLGRKVQKVFSRGVDKVLGTNATDSMTESAFDEGSPKNQAAKKLVERDTAGEKIGGFVGDTASYVVPGVGATKAAKGLNFLGRVGTLAGSDASVTIARKGDVDREALDTAIISAVFPVAGAGATLAKGVLPAGKDAGGKVINSLIKPLLKDFAYGKNPGKAVAEAGITANNLDELATKIGQERKNVGAEIGAIAKQSKERFDLDDALAPIDEAITEAAKNPRTNSAIIRRLNDLRDDLLRVTTDESDMAVAGRTLKDMSAEEAAIFKTEVGDLARWTGNASDDEIVNRALTKTYGRIKGQIDTQIPELVPLNEKYANLKSAEIATQYRDKIAARQNLVSFSGVQTGTAAALVAAIVSGGALVPIIAGAGAAGFTQAMKTPAVKTRLASWLAAASPKEKAEAFKKAPWLRGALQSMLLGEESDESGGGPKARTED